MTKEQLELKAEEYVRRHVSYGGLEYDLNGAVHKEHVETCLAGMKLMRDLIADLAETHYIGVHHHFYEYEKKLHAVIAKMGEK